MSGKRGCLRLNSMADVLALKNRVGAPYPSFPSQNKFRAKITEADGIKFGSKKEAAQLSTKNKFNAVICEADNIKFRSKKERKRYLELKALQTAGECWFLRQVPFYLPGNTKYVLDFLIFWKNGTYTFEDTKGKRTPMFIMKKKQVESLYPVKIIEG